MKRIFTLCVAICIAITFGSAAADDFISLSQISKSGSTWYAIAGHRAGIGRIKGTLRVTRTASIPVTFKGESSERTRKVDFEIISGKVIAPRFKGRESFFVKGIVQRGSKDPLLFIPLQRSSGIRRTFTVEPAKSGLRITRAIPVQQFRCAADEQTKQNIAPLRQFQKRSGNAPFIVIGVDIDSRFSKFHKTKALLAAVLALQKTAQVYSATFSYTLRVGAITQFTSSSTDPVAARFGSSVALLSAYQQYRATQPIAGADMYHLMTAQRGFLDAIGLAHIGTTCANPQFAVGWSDYASGFFFFAQTLMHEIGHNFNATHDTTDPLSLMAVSGTTNIINPYFSSFSTSEISSFVGSNGACLSDDSGSEIPTPSASSYRHPYEKASSIIMTTSRGRCGTKVCLKGKITSRSGSPLSGRIVELLSFPPAQLLKTTTTNRYGEYRFNLSSSGSYYISDRMSQKTSKRFKK